jgi:hypothetical protein
MSDVFTQKKNNFFFVKMIQPIMQEYDSKCILLP